MRQDTGQETVSAAEGDLDFERMRAVGRLNGGYAEAVELQKAFIIEGAAANAIPAQFAVFMLKCNHGMMEPQAGDTDGENDNVSMQVNGKGQTA